MDLREGPSALRHIRGSGGVTARQKAFADEYIKNGGCGARAWRKAYHSDYSHPNSPSHLAHMALRRPAVRQYLERKLARMVTRAQITEDTILSKLETAYDLAHGQGKATDMISAANSQAKLVGLLRDRLETSSPGGFDNLENVSDVLAKLAEAIGDPAAQRIGVALGVLPAPTPDEAKQPTVQVEAKNIAQDTVDLLVTRAGSDILQ